MSVTDDDDPTAEHQAPLAADEFVAWDDAVAIAFWLNTPRSTRERIEAWRKAWEAANDRALKAERETRIAHGVLRGVCGARDRAKLDRDAFASLAAERTQLARNYHDALEEQYNKIDLAVALAVRYGGANGAHHKTWVIDQIVRILAGDEYDEVIAEAKQGKDGPNTYDWDVGISP